MTKVSKDLYVTPNEEGVGISLYSNSLGKRIIIDKDEILPLIQILQAEYETIMQESINTEIDQIDGDHPCPACGGEVGHRINCKYGIAFSDSGDDVK